MLFETCMLALGTGKNQMSYRNADDDIAARSLPHGRVLLDGLVLTFERLRSSSKVAVSLPLLRAIISVTVSKMPFDPTFYLETYPDIREAYEAGHITDLRTHFIDTGYFEGRFGTEPAFDEPFYRSTYPDVVEALTTSETNSFFDHYLRAGAFEGRHANAVDQENAKQWTKLFQPGETQHAGSGSRR